jgi:dienelactone hydrolase
MSHDASTTAGRAAEPITGRAAGPAATPITGRAAGVPFVALPPAGGPRPSAPVVLAWHLLDPPRTEAAFAAAVPLHGLDAWRIFLGLPLSGSRLPAGGPDEVMRLGYEDAVLRLHRPTVYGAAEEAGPALAELRERLEIGAGPVALVGGSAGAAVAQLVLAEGDLDVRAAVLISPVVQLRGAIEAGERRYGFAYAWSDESRAVADRLDFLARADEIARRRPAVLLVVGEQDDPAIREPAARLRDALAPTCPTELVTIPDMVHALADEPGTDPAPQTPHAAAVDGHATRWLGRHLVGRS